MLLKNSIISLLILVLVIPPGTKGGSIRPRSLKFTLRVQVIILGAFLSNQLVKLYLFVGVWERELNSPNFAAQVNSFLPLINFAASLNSL